jgi:hypothetical protein
MNRFIAFLFLFLSHFSLANTLGFPSISVPTERVQTNLRENSGFIATGDNIKKLEVKQLELLSLINVNRDTAQADSHNREILKSLILETDYLFKSWSALSIEKIQTSTKSSLTAEEALKLEELSSQLESHQSLIAQKILELSRLLDF